ncbi:MAG: dTDP-4-dehydrorhamnose reductase [Elusimicrobia bacterium]|nr:dTDP-4-dehydrorhamnose reductase [Elusimicrobiota bacterium]
MRLLITGAGGQLGTALQTVFSDAVLFPLGHGDLDISHRDRVLETVRRLKPDLVINAAAYNAVDKAETERDAAFAANEAGPRHLAEAAAEAGVPIVHVSTDYVFDGRLGRPYREDDPTHPLSVYGQSKLAGEEAVRRANPKHFVVRTAWLYHDTGRNFFRLMLALSEKGPVRAVSDQRSSPTYAPHLAQGLRRLVDTGAFGTYHMAGAGGPASRFDELKEFYRRIGHRGTVEPVSMAQFPQPASRPKFTPLETARTPRIVLPDWREGVAAFAAAFLKAGGK